MKYIWVAVIILSISFLAVYVFFERDMRRAAERVESGRRVAETACSFVEYGEKGSGAPVLVIHGAGGGYDQGLKIGELLLGEGYRVIAPSRFGYLGAGIPDDASNEAQADVYACLLDFLGVDKAFVLGYSAGGPSALQFALRHPQRSRALIMISAISYTEPLTDETRQRLESDFNRILGSDFFYWAMENAAPDRFLGLIGVPVNVLTERSETDKQIAAQLLELMHPMSRRFPGILLDQTREAPHTWPLDQIVAPTFIVHARDDTLAPFSNGERSAATIPGANFWSLESGGHLLVGRMEEVHNILVHFLNGVTQ